MMHPKNLPIADFTYELPSERIAAHPLQERDASKLLVYKKNIITEGEYKNIAQFIPENSVLVFNNTRVIPARIKFQKPTGGEIEIFCLEPMGDNKDYQQMMQRTQNVTWKCMVGGAGKWKSGLLNKTIVDVASNKSVELQVELKEKQPDGFVINFSWNAADLSFAEVLSLFGNMPLPPYIKRATTEEDKKRYQTIYAIQEGSVAAPTAGLHFTERVFKSFEQKNIQHDFVTLHVGAGTFKPVKSDYMEGHDMHAEWFEVSRESIIKLKAQLNKHIIAVGTTSARTLETLYWMGVKCLQKPVATLTELQIQQWDVYESPLNESKFSMQEALDALLQWMELKNLSALIASTQILIAPGYQYRVIKAIVTNFHQPQSTLLLLVSAAVGDNWKCLYEHALANDFRFLSYGDGSLLFIENTME